MSKHLPVIITIFAALIFVYEKSMRELDALTLFDPPIN